MVMCYMYRSILQSDDTCHYQSEVAKNRVGTNPFGGEKINQFRNENVEF